MTIRRKVQAVATLLLCIVPFALAQEAGETVIKQGAIKEDLYLAGGTIDVTANVEGDVTAVGGQITIDHQVSGDINAAGGNIIVRARVGDDVRLAAGNVMISGAVADDAIAAGGQVSLAPSATVGGRAWLAGHTITVAGKVGKSLKAAGKRVIVTGEIAGDAQISAETIEIEPSAVIRGNLTYRSRNDARIATGAKIGGKVIREATVAHPEERMNIRTAVARSVFYLGLLLTGVVLYLLFPIASIGAARTIADSPWKSLGLGLAFLAAVPLVIAFLFATVFGIWLALAALVIYLLALLLGFLTGVIYIGEAGSQLLTRHAEGTMGWRVFAIVVAFLVVWVARFVPVLGAITVFALMIFGLGALVLYLSRRYVSEA